MKHEVWKPVVGYEGWYEVSNNGRLKRVKSACGTFAGRILKPFLSKNTGYFQVDLFKSNSGKRRSVHCIVAESFVGPSRGKEVNHIDGDKTNNEDSNLEYVTRSENTLHAYSLGLIPRGSKSHRSILTEVEVLEIKQLLGNETHKVIAEKFNVTESTISAISSGGNWLWLTQEGQYE